MAAVVLAADYWICLPEGAMQSATYVGRQVCAECHEKETREWTGSDHDLAMDHATPETVLGDFNDRQFAHLAFDDVVKLSDAEVQALLERVDVPRWATALHDAGKPVEEKIVGNMSEEDRARLREARARLEAVRPCDVADAHRRIGDAMRQLKDEGRIRADFAVTSKLFRRGDEFFVTTDNRDGEMQTFEVKYTFGVRPLQQYLVGFPDGRVQCLPLAWDSETKAWFHLYPKEPIPHHDVLHWTGRYQNWNYMCAECHSTNLQKNYRLADDTYHTTFSEIDVSCETCHGPGSVHVELAEHWGFWDRRLGYGLPRLKDENPRVEIETCAPCHSRRRIVYPGSRPGGKLLDHYIPEVLDNNLYYADGQVLDEDYVYGSFIQSLMYSKGIRCTNCHDPHTARVKFMDPAGPWNQLPDNRLCGQTGCHTPATYDTPTHHHHPDASKPGTRCVECHMPETTYMVVDPRRDHSLRVPRPDLTVAMDIPNACNLPDCHDDAEKGETAQWAEQKVRQWYGPRDDPPHFAHAIAAGRERKPEGEKLLAEVARRKDHRPIVRASAISLLSAYGGDDAEFRVLEGLEDPDELVRAVAARSLQSLPSDETPLYERLAPLLHDPVRAVRAEAARILTAVPRDAFSKEDGEAFDTALAEYIKAQEFLGDQPGSHLNLAVAYTNLAGEELDRAGDTYQAAMVRAELACRSACDLANLAYDSTVKDDPAAKEEAYQQWESQIQKAEKGRASQQGAAQAEHRSCVRKATQKALEAYLAALRLDPHFVPARNNLAMLYDQRGEKHKAEEQFHEVIRLEPEMAEAHYSLGLLLAEDQKRLEEASGFLSTAARLAPENPRIHYNSGLALQKLGQLGEAEKALTAALRLTANTPASLEFLYALAHLHVEQDQWDKVKGCADQLARLSQNMPEGLGFFWQVIALYAQKDRWTEASKYAERLLELSAGKRLAVPYLAELAVLYVQRGEWERARVCVEELLRLDPANPRWYKLRDSIERASKAPERVKAMRHDAPPPDGLPSHPPPNEGSTHTSLSG